MSKAPHTIQVFGSGCPNCKKLHEAVKRAVKDLGSEIEVEYVTDITKLLELGVMQSPALVIDGKTVAAGFIPSAEQLKELIGGVVCGDDETCCGGGSDSGSGCGCGGSC